MFIFDACTAINIIHIDADEFIQKKIDRIGYKICKAVSDEIQKHAFDKYKNLPQLADEEIKRIHLAITYFRNRIHFPEAGYLNLKAEIAKLTGYAKENGEFHSVLLAFFLFRNDGKKVTFYTDDAPAKNYFSPYFSDHHIGKIEDLVDLLTLLQVEDAEFTINDLKKYLSNLSYEISSMVKGLERDILKFEIPKNQIKNQKFRSMLENIRTAVRSLDLNRLKSLSYEVLDNKKEFAQLYDILIRYKDFFNQNISRAYFDKIKNSLKMAS
jgi:hypothetical protein